MHNAATAAARYENTTTAGGQEEGAAAASAAQRSQNKQNRCALFSCCCGATEGERERASSLAHCGCCRPTWPLQVSAKKPTAAAAAATG